MITITGRDGSGQAALMERPISLDEPTRKAVQAALLDMGFYEGKSDGWFANLTWRAIRLFQTYLGREPDGDLKADELKELLPAPSDLPPEIATPNIAPEPMGTAISWPDYNGIRKFYGEPGLNMTMLNLPYQMALAWDKETKIRRFSIHEKAHDSAWRVFKRIAEHYSADEIKNIGLDLFGGCVNVRKMCGSSKMSVHAWGAAIDLNPAQNQLTWPLSRARFGKPDCDALHRFFEEEGWVNLGRAKNRDAMHFQAVRI